MQRSISALAAAVLVLATGFSAPPKDLVDTIDVRAKIFQPTATMPWFPERLNRMPDVCKGGACNHTSIAAAHAAAEQGDTLFIAPGIYSECLVTGGKSIAIIGLEGADGARPVFRKPCAGKAAFVVSSRQFLLQGVHIEGIRVPDRNGACLRLEGSGQVQRVALVEVTCVDSQNGILGSVGDGSLILRKSHFARNGGNRGYAHGLYIVGGAEVWIDQSTVLATKGQGHSVKVGAKRLIVDASTIAALNGRNSRAIDFFGGGVLIVRSSVLQQGPGSDNNDVIAIGMEPNRHNVGAFNTVLLHKSWVLYDDPSRVKRVLFKGAKLGPIHVEDTRLVGLTGTDLAFREGANVERYDSRQSAGLARYNALPTSLPSVP